MGPYPESSTSARGNTPGDQEVTNEAAAALFQSPINQPADALHLLLEASGRTGDLHRQASSGNSRPNSGVIRKANADISERSISADTQKPLNGSKRPHYAMDIDPAITNNTGTGREVDSGRFREMLKIWSRLRFVRAGWFTAREAMLYID